jgi:O-antigen/teichoic acid export membrane protein
MISSIGWLILGYTDTAVLTLFRTMEEVGLYNVVLPTVSLLFYFTAAVSIVILPMVSEMWARKHNEKLKNGLKMIYNYSLVFILPFALLMFVFPEIILNLLFGPQYVIASNALRILSIGSIFYTIAYINLNIISGIGKPKITSYIVLAAALFNLIGNFILIPKYGIIGAAITTAIGFFIMLVISLIYISKKMGFCLNLFDNLKIIFNNLFFLFIIYLMKNMPLNIYFKILLSCFVGFGIYLLLNILLKTIDLKFIKNLIVK